jgi:hypothetical protein
VTCPNCQQAAEFKGYRPKSVESLLGSITVSRGYYHCGRCGQGLFPFDATTGLGCHRLTPGAARVVSLLGLIGDSFQEAAAKLLPEACGLHLSESTVQRVTEDAGARLGTLHEQGHTLGESKPFTWHQDANGRTCAYVSLDLTAVPQQAQDGGTAEGRMPYVAAIYNPVPDKPKPAQPLPTPGTRPAVPEAVVPEAVVPEAVVPEAVASEVADTAAAAVPGVGTAAQPGQPRMQARYIAGLMSLAALGVLLRQQAAQVGMEKAQQWIGLSDGGSGLEDFLRSNFNRVDMAIILDFWHPTGYLETLAGALYSDDAEKRQQQMQQWCHTMKHEGGAAILKVLQGLDPPKKKTAQEALQEAVQYIGNNIHRMDYPYYLAQGWQIGSGPIESACKTVVGQRLKLAGMRWREYGTDNVSHLRALFKSDKDQWEAFWERKVN